MLKRLWILKRHFIRSYEAGLRFYRDEFVGILPAGTHWLFDPMARARVEIVSLRQPWLAHDKLDLIVKSPLPTLRRCST